MTDEHAPGRAGTRATWLRQVVRDRQLPLILLLAPFFLVNNLLLNMAGLAGCAVLLAVRRRATGSVFPPSPIAWPLAGLLAMTAVGLAVSLAPELSQSPALGTWYGVALFFAVVGSVVDRRGLRTLVGALVLGAAALVVVALLGTDWTDKTLTYLPAWIYQPLPQVLGAFSAGSFGQARGGFNPNEIALALGMALPLPLSLALLPRAELAGFAGASRWRPILRRPVLVAITLLCLAVIVLTQSRGTLGALILAGTGIALLRWPALRRRWRLLGGLAVAGGVAVALLVLANPGLQARLLDPSGQGIGSGSRLVIWQRSLPMIADFPLTGIGLNTFPVIQPVLYPAFQLSDTRWVHAHNLYLQTALDLGLPGLLCLLWLLAVLAHTLWQSGRGVPAVYQALAAAVGASILVWLADGLIDAPIRLGAKAGLGLWLTLGLAFVLARAASEQTMV